MSVCCASIWIEVYKFNIVFGRTGDIHDHISNVQLVLDAFRIEGLDIPDDVFFFISHVFVTVAGVSLFHSNQLTIFDIASEFSGRIDVITPPLESQRNAGKVQCCSQCSL